MQKQNIAITILFAILVGVGVLIFEKNNNKRISLDSTNQNENINTDDNSNKTNSKNLQETPTNSPQKETAMKKTYTEQPVMQLKDGVKYQAVLETSAGNIQIELNSEMTPITVNNFVSLAKDGFYDETIFHRAISGFMIQGGDPEGTGMGGPGYKFADEDFQGEYSRGVVAMANSGPNTNGSQFFIMHQDYALSPNYIIFGKVVKGLETVDAIATAETVSSASGEKSKPVEPITVKTIKILEN